MAAIVKGLSVVYSGPRRRFTPGVGWTTFERYEFSNSADANAFAGAQAAAGLIVDLDDRAPSYPVEVAAPDSGGGSGDEVVDIYELPPLDEQVDIVSSLPFAELIPEIQSGLRAYLADTSDTAYEDFDAAIAASGHPAPDIAAGRGMLLLMHKGTRSFTKPTTEFRWTRIVSDSRLTAGLSGAYDSINMIFETPTLIASVAPPTVWSNAITAAAAAIPAATGNYNKGWLKMQPAITRRGLNRNEITLRWILENWSNDLYYTA